MVILYLILGIALLIMGSILCIVSPVPGILAAIFGILLIVFSRKMKKATTSAPDPQPVPHGIVGDPPAPEHFLFPHGV